MARLTTVKDVQTHLRHSTSKTTLEHYIKSAPESVRVAVESLDHLLKKAPENSGQRKMEHDLVFHKGGQPVRQRKIKVEFRRLS